MLAVDTGIRSRPLYPLLSGGFIEPTAPYPCATCTVLQTEPQLDEIDPPPLRLTHTDNHLSRHNGSAH